MDPDDSVWSRPSDIVRDVIQMPEIELTQADILSESKFLDLHCFKTSICKTLADRLESLNMHCDISWTGIISFMLKIDSLIIHSQTHAIEPIFIG